MTRFFCRSILDLRAVLPFSSPVVTSDDMHILSYYVQKARRFFQFRLCFRILGHPVFSPVSLLWFRGIVEMKLFRNAKQWFFSQYGPLGLNRSEPARVLVPRKTSLRHLSERKPARFICPVQNWPASIVLGQTCQLHPKGKRIFVAKKMHSFVRWYLRRFSVSSSFSFSSHCKY